MKIRALIVPVLVSFFLVSCNSNPVDGLVDIVEEATSEVNNAKDVSELYEAIETGQKNVRSYIKDHADELDKYEDDKEAQEKLEKANTEMEEAIEKQLSKYGEKSSDSPSF